MKIWFDCGEMKFSTATLRGSVVTRIEPRCDFAEPNNLQSLWVSCEETIVVIFDARDFFSFF